MFDILFGWRKASKCKNLIKRVQCRLKLLKNKRDSIIRQSREDVAQLLKNGQEQTAFSRADQLIKDQSIVTAYNLLDHFCEFIIIQFPYIRKHRDCPNDINEAVSSLAFAAARCGDLPELQKLRKLFGERYGHRLVMAAVELFHGNLVNRQIKEKLCIKSIPDDEKLRLIHEIARDYGIQLGPLGTEDRFNLQHHQVSDPSVQNGDCKREVQVSEKDIQVIYNSDSNIKKIQENPRSIIPLSYIKKFFTESCQSHSSLDITSTAVAAGIFIQPAPNMVQPLCFTLISKSAVRVDKHEQLYEAGIIIGRPSGQSNPGSSSSSRLSTASTQHKVERITTGAASESSSQFPETSIVYLDDVEEFRPMIDESTTGKDQRLFMFKSTILDNCADGRTSLSDLYSDGYPEDNTESCEPCRKRTSSRSSSKKRNSAMKRLKRRSICWESRMYSLKDIEYESYYGYTCDDSPKENLLSHRTRQQRNHQQKMLIEASQCSSFASRERKRSLPQQPYETRKISKEFLSDEVGGAKRFSLKYEYSQRRSYSRSNCNHDIASDCCLEHPCYSFASDDRDESLIWKQHKGTRSVVLPSQNHQQEECCLSFCSSNDEAVNNTASANGTSYGQVINKNTRFHEVGWNSPPHKLRRRRDHENNVIVCAIVASQNSRPSKQHKKVGEEEEEEEEISHCRQASYASSYGSYSRVTKTQTRAPYLRAMTLPPERPKNTPTDITLRSASCQFRQPNNSNGSFSSSCSPHVHPRLPDCDELEAKFMALKKEHLQSKHQSS